MLSKTRNATNVIAFFKKAINSSGLPEKITIDKSGANNLVLSVINSQLIILYLFTAQREKRDSVTESAIANDFLKSRASLKNLISFESP